MTSGIVIIFVIFTLLQREDLRNRLIKLAGSHDLQKTTVALNDAAERLSRLFLSQLALNSAFGLVIGTGLWFIGVPSAVLWGILAGILRFVPYIGVFIAAVFPLLLAVAVDPGWSMLLWSAAFFVIVEPLVGQVIAQYRPITACRCCVRDILDRAVGSGRPCPCDSFNDLPRRSWPSR
jgi:predicted PurR-regulated permease PerM